MRLADKNVTEVAHDRGSRIGDYTWAPIGNTLAWSMTDSDEVSSSVYVWQATEGKLHRVTTSTFNEFNPAWDPDGNYLYYLSNRFYEPQISQDEFNYATARQTGIFALALRKGCQESLPDGERRGGGRHVGGAPVRRAGAARRRARADAGRRAQGGAMDPQEIRIDFDGIETRVARVPIEADNISRLIATKTALLYVVNGAPYYSRQSERRPVLTSYSLKDRRASVILDNAGNFAMSRDQKKLITNARGLRDLRRCRQRAVRRASPSRSTGSRSIACRARSGHRSSTKSGAATATTSTPRTCTATTGRRSTTSTSRSSQYVDHRADLNYVIQEMISELSVQHTYIAGGDFQIPPRTPVALAGAEFTLDSASGKYRISKIYAGRERGGDVPVAAHRNRRRREGRRVCPGRSTATSCEETTIRIACSAAKRTAP